MELNCQISIPEIPGLEFNQLTVGRPFDLLCQGETAGFNFSQAQLILDVEHKHDFNLKKATAGKIEMVTYLTGDIEPTVVKISDSVQELDLKIPAFKVISVLPAPQKNEEGVVQPPEPFGYNILNIQWPASYTVIFIVLLCALIAGLVNQALRARRFRRLNSELKDYESALSPDSQFYKHLRLLDKRKYPIKEVERQFHIYVIRRYQVPLFGLSPSETTKFLKKTWPTLILERRDLKNILSDLKKMTVQESVDETQKYLRKLYDFVDRTEEKMRGLS
ncbi:MAG: hypothetical protein H7Z71_01545 [Moraxellaceae bacterium]|nr:hypothetical protein [Pseudobdellovibrionaceae bacterium]